MSLESGAWAPAKHPSSPERYELMIKKKSHSAREQAKDIHRAATLGDTVISGLGSLVAVGIVLAARLFPESTP